MSGNRIHHWIFRCGAALAMSIALTACATTTYQPPPPPPPPVPAPVVEVPGRSHPAPQYGVASWYGPGFNGHRTSDGQIYNQNDLTAASMIYPLGSRVMVTNLDTGRSVEVKINDHGPLKKGRKIDLSHKAATMIGMLDKGTAHVKIELAVGATGLTRGRNAATLLRAGGFVQQLRACTRAERSVEAVLWRRSNRGSGRRKQSLLPGSNGSVRDQGGGSSARQPGRENWLSSHSQRLRRDRRE